MRKVTSGQPFEKPFDRLTAPSEIEGIEDVTDLDR
jgi:hypothetical protein